MPDAAGKTDEQPILDVPEGTEYQIPAALLERVTHFQPGLASASVQYQGPASWQNLTEVLRYETPLDLTAEEICCQILSIVYRDIERREGRRQDVPRYRAQLGIAQHGRIRYRYASLAPKVGPDGLLLVTDGSSEDQGESEAVAASKLLAEVAESHAKISLDCLEAVAKSVKSLGGLNDVLGAMVGGYTSIAKQASEGQAEVLRIKMEAADRMAAHEASVYRTDRIADLLEKAGKGRFGQEMGQLLRDVMRQRMRDAARPKGDRPDGAKRLPQRLRVLWSEIGNERRDRILAALSHDECGALMAMLNAQDEHEFVAYAQRLVGLWADRDDPRQTIETIERELGDHLEGFHEIMADVADAGSVQ